MKAARDGTSPRTSVAYDAEMVRRLWAFARPHQRWIWLGFALLLFTSTCRLALPWVVKLAIDDHLSETGADLAGYGTLVALFGALAVGEMVGKALQTWVIDVAGQNALFDLRSAVFRHLQKLSASFHDRTPIGRLIGRITTDVEALHEMFASGVITVLGDLVFLAATISILLSMSVGLTLMTLTVVPVLLIATLFIRQRVRLTYAALVSERSRINAFLHEHVVGMPLVQMFVTEDRVRSRFADSNEGLCEAQVRGVHWESYLSALMEMLGSVTLALILWYGGGMVLGSEAGAGPGDALTLGALFAFIDYMQRFFGPLNDLSLQYTVMQNAMAASERIFALLDEEEITPLPVSPRRPAPGTSPGAIEFSGVGFGYDPSNPVLHDLSFSVSPGERVAIVGATGAGKTTILKLLTRLYDISSGSIRLDGVDVREYALGDLRRRMGIVPQDVFLFEGTVLENVHLGQPHIAEEEAVRAADRLNLDQVVARFPLGYDEPVRERGANLSAGERQLISFARALAAEPEALALDEATSSVDTHTESLLQDAVHKLMEGRTALIVAHRLSTIRDVDRILVLHRGELVEEGTHTELLARRGVYWRLYRLQYAGQEAGR